MFDKPTLKASVKSGLNSLGLVKLLHFLRNRNCLTVVMFHLVLSENDERWEGCDLAWTVPEHIFESCIVFFKKNYSVVGLHDIERSSLTGDPLPHCPLLVTFDDGWADNAEHALPILQKHEVPALLFLATGSIGMAEPLNEELLHHAWKTGQFSVVKASLAKGGNVAGLEAEDDVSACMRIFRSLSGEEKNRVVQRVKEYAILPTQNAMLSEFQLEELLQGGVEFGSHGVSHEPMTSSREMIKEFGESRQAVREIVGRNASTGDCSAFSFPHGVYTSELLTQAYKVGYKYVFTSDPYRVALEKHRVPVAKPLGRIPIQYSEIIDSKGRFSEFSLSFWLMNRGAR